MKKNSQNLRVAFLYDDSLDKNDGVPQFVKRIGTWLSDQGIGVCYLVGQTKLESWAGGRVYSLAKNITVPFNGNRVATPMPASLSNIKRVLDAEKFDVLHVQVPYSPFMAQRVINRVPTDVGVVGTFHILPTNFLAEFGTRLLRFVYGKSLRRFDELLAVSPAAAVFAQKSLGIEAVVLPNVVDIGRMRVKYPVNQPNHIVFLGRLVKRKGCAELLRAFAILKKRLPEARLTIAGGGPEKSKLEDFVRKNGLSSSVAFTGFIDEKDKPQLLASGAIACFPSLGGESFGIVLIEAMAAGAGVVMGGNNPGYASVLGENLQTLVDPGNSHKFAEQIEKFLTDQSLATRLHEQQQELVKQYDVNEVGKQLLQVYAQAIASRRQKT